MGRTKGRDGSLPGNGVPSFLPPIVETEDDESSAEEERSPPERVADGDDISETGAYSTTDSPLYSPLSQSMKQPLGFHPHESSSRNQELGMFPFNCSSLRKPFLFSCTHFLVCLMVVVLCRFDMHLFVVPFV